MKIILRTLLLLTILIPSVTFSESDSNPGLRHQVDRLIIMVAGLEQQLYEANKEISLLRTELDEIKNNTVLDLNGLLSLAQDANGFYTALFSGVNVQVVNGTGLTESPNGQGNLILGYNNIGLSSPNRTGSHNFIVGDEHTYPNTAELFTNAIVSDLDLDITAGGNITSSAGANQAIIVGQNLSLQVGGDALTEIGESALMSIGKNADLSVGSDMGITVAGNTTLATSGSTNILSEEDAIFESGEELVISVDKASASFNRAGDIIVNGKKIEVIGTGNISIKAGAELNLKGAVINQN